jgi:dipeptidyl aminopeptidase/acylaminoacyl peptidase
MAPTNAFRKGLALIVVSVVLAACGNSPTATPKATPTARPSAAALPFPSPTPGGPAPPPRATVTCASKIPSGSQLALVTLRGGSGIVVRDVTDVGHPVSRCSISAGVYLRFVNGTHISYIVMASSDLGAPGALYLVDLQTQTTSLVRAWTYGGYLSWVYAWSPDGQALTYLTSDSTAVVWHLLSASGDRILSTLGPVPGRGVNPDEDDGMVGFSADGQYVAMEETNTSGYKSTISGLAPPLQVVRVADGKLVYSRTDATMAAWSAGAGQRFYFRTATGVQSWEPSGQVRTLAAGLSWIKPWPSADGSHIAYSALDTQGNHKVAVIDVAGGTPNQLSAEPRVRASFITPALVWYQGETVCTATAPCGLGGPPLTGVTYISDLVGVETESIDANFYDSWPHVAGQS